MNCLELTEVTKTYATKTAVDGVSLAIAQGTVFGLLGPNGAGKTSLIRMITHITLPDAGRIQFMGQPLQEQHQAQIGYMPEERGLYKKMTVLDQIVYLLELKGMKRAAAKQAASEWLQRFELHDWAQRKVDQLSKGMQQKVQFILTVAHRPPLLILDEPFSGLDPLNSQLIEDVIRDLSAQGSTILFSTHRMEQVESFCERIALINNGRLVLEGAVRQLRRAHAKQEYILESEEDLGQLQLPAGVLVQGQGQPHRIKVKLPEGMQPRQFLAQVNERVVLSRYEEHLPDLREIFIDAVTQSNHTATPSHA